VDHAQLCAVRLRHDTALPSQKPRKDKQGKDKEPKDAAKEQGGAMGSPVAPPARGI
jgi:hypothetical protein